MRIGLALWIHDGTDIGKHLRVLLLGLWFVSGREVVDARNACMQLV
jgi:hypothetical protein